MLSGMIITAIARAWKGRPWDEVEILNGKAMTPTPGKKKTILLGRCMSKKNADHPDIREVFAVKSCPPNPEQIIKALHWAGIEADPQILRHMDRYPAAFLKRYQGNRDFDESFFTVPE
jgi:hypothetical protein